MGTQLTLTDMKGRFYGNVYGVTRVEQKDESCIFVYIGAELIGGFNSYYLKYKWNPGYHDFPEPEPQPQPAPESAEVSA